MSDNLQFLNELGGQASAIQQLKNEEITKLTDVYNLDLNEIATVASAKETVGKELEIGSEGALGFGLGAKGIYGKYKSWKAKRAEDADTFKGEGAEDEDGSLLDRLQGGIEDIADRATSGIEGAISDVASRATGAVEGVVSDITNTAENAISNATGAVNNVLSDATNAVKNAVSQTQNAIDTTTTGVEEGINDATSAIKNATSGMGDLFSGFKGTVADLDSAINVPTSSGATSGLSDLFSSFKGTVADLGDNINQLGNNFENIVSSATEKFMGGGAGKDIEMTDIGGGSEFTGDFTKLQTPEISGDTTFNDLFTSKYTGDLKGDETEELEEPNWGGETDPFFKIPSKSGETAPFTRRPEPPEEKEDFPDLPEEEKEDFPDLPEQGAVGDGTMAEDIADLQDTSDIANITTDTSYGVPATSSTVGEVAGETALEGVDEAVGSALDLSGIGAIIGVPLQILGLLGAIGGTVGGIVESAKAGAEETSDQEQAYNKYQSAKTNLPTVAGKFADPIQSTAGSFLGR